MDIKINNINSGKKPTKSRIKPGKKALDKVGEILGNEPLTKNQKLLMRKCFERIQPLQQKCTYCSREVKNDHLKRLASHFLRCPSVPDDQRELFLSMACKSSLNILSTISLLRYERLEKAKLTSMMASS